MRRIALVVFAAALALVATSSPSAAGGCINNGRPTEGTSADVRIDKCQFMSAILRVPVGTTVTWTNDDFLPHEISGIGWGRIQSMLMTGDTFSHAFTETGIYPYTCPLHPGMSAVVFVGDVSAPASRQNTVASRVEGAPVGPVDPSQDGPWAAMAIVAIAAAGVAGFAIGQRARER